MSYFRVYSREVIYVTLFVPTKTFILSNSLQNCESECVTKIYYANCNCILYYMPRIVKNITICGRADRDCVFRVKEELQLQRNDSFICNCFYGCHAIKFEMALSSAPIFKNAPAVKRRDLTAGNTSLLHIYYQRGYYRGLDKEELIGFTEFLCRLSLIIYKQSQRKSFFGNLTFPFSSAKANSPFSSANIGGLLGLFMGFSIFSIIEVLYFLSIRPWCSYVKEKKKNRKLFKRTNHRFDIVKSIEDSKYTNSVSPETLNTIVFRH